MKKILILTTGGTIASRPSGDGLVPGDIKALLYDKMAPLVGDFQVEIKTVFSKDSSNIVPSDWDTVAAAIRNDLANFDGIVVLHGTDTMSYSAAMLSYRFIGADKPIVITGSQLPLVEEGSDGVINLNDAVITAADGRLQGVFVVFHDKIMNGTRTYKRSSVNPDAYISCNYPYAGVVKDSRIYLTEEYWKIREMERSPKTRAKASSMLKLMEEGKNDLSKEACRIFMLKMVPGFDADVLDYVRTRNYNGVVIEGFGLGGLPMADAGLTGRLKRLIESNIPVIMATQCVYDGVNLDTYEVGVMANRIGVVSAFDMTSEAAYTKLMWILSMTRDFEQIKRAMQTNFCGEILDAHATEV